MTPKLGQVYRTPDGKPMFYVRTEKLPGMDGPEHLFICTRNGTVFQRWTKEMPPEFELIIDAEARGHANEQEWLRLVAEHERDLAFELLSQAVAWLPRERARVLRQRWRDAQPPEPQAT